MTTKDALLAANAAYYRAFSARDFAAMDALWALEGVSCVHPGWPPLIGRTAILGSYRDIFRNPRQEPVRCGDETVLVASDEARVFCVESVAGAALVATNWFRLIEGQWRMIHHQAGPLAMAAEETPTTRPSFH
jgi:hypothetical protein